MEDYIKLIGAELTKAASAAEEVPTQVGMLSVKTANETCKDAAQRPNPAALYLSLWYEGEVCCLFADSNLGKSVLATQIATSIAERQKVIYFDFELSDKQFQSRYTDDCGNLYQFPGNLFRSEIDPDAYTVENFEEAIIQDIENAAIQTGAKVLIIDNLTYLCNASEKGDVAGLLMMKLMGLKRKHGLSLLIVAHTPKRPLNEPLNQNSLAGSKRLFNFFDSAFALGRSARDSNVVYLKQLKCRHGEYTYDADNVIVMALEKLGAFLQFTTVGYATEAELLRTPSDQDAAAQVSAIKQLASEGKSYRTIAAELGITLSKVQRIMRK